MKKNLLIVILFFYSVINSFSQEEPMKINISPETVYSSVVVEFDFEKKSKFQIFVMDAKLSETLEEFEIIKSQGSVIKKLDFSTLPSGSYTLRILEFDKIVYEKKFSKK